MPNSTPPVVPDITSGNQPSGAFLRMLYVERELKGYAVTAAEIRQLGTINRLATVFFSLGSGAVGYALGLGWEIATNPSEQVVQTVGQALTYFCIGFAVLCFVVAGILAHARKSEIDKILSETR